MVQNETAINKTSEDGKTTNKKTDTIKWGLGGYILIFIHLHEIFIQRPRIYKPPLQLSGQQQYPTAAPYVTMPLDHGSLTSARMHDASGRQ